MMCGRSVHDVVFAADFVRRFEILTGNLPVVVDYFALVSLETRLDVTSLQTIPLMVDIPFSVLVSYLPVRLAKLLLDSHDIEHAEVYDMPLLLTLAYGHLCTLNCCILYPIFKPLVLMDSHSDHTMFSDRNDLWPVSFLRQFPCIKERYSFVSGAMAYVGLARMDEVQARYGINCSVFNVPFEELMFHLNYADALTVARMHDVISLTTDKFMASVHSHSCANNTCAIG